MQQRAYSLLTVKAVEDDTRVIRGVATTPAVDRVGDIIDPLGVKFSNPMPFLWQHEHDQPVGAVAFDKPTKGGIPFEAKLVHPDAVESATLKDRLQLAWDSLKTKLVRAVSIGFRPIEYSFMENGGVHFQEVEVFELSAVTIPANAEAVITQIKAGDPQVLAVIKQFDVGALELPALVRPAEAPGPAASGKTVHVAKLAKEARVRAPFVINRIHRLG